MFNESQNKAAEDVSETSGYMAETSETVVDFPLQVEDFASVEENVADSPAVDEQLPVVDVAPVSDGAGDNITVSEASFVETQPVAEVVPAASSETPAAAETNCRSARAGDQRTGCRSHEQKARFPRNRQNQGRRQLGRSPQRQQTVYQQGSA